MLNCLQSYFHINVSKWWAEGERKEEKEKGGILRGNTWPKF